MKNDSTFETIYNYFFKKILDESKMTDLIKKNFNLNYEDIIQVVLFQLIQSKPPYLMEYFFCDKILSSKYSSQNLSKLFYTLGESESKIQTFLEEWIDINKIQDTLFYDLTSISSYSAFQK